jgi:hypothetical protein
MGRAMEGAHEVREIAEADVEGGDRPSSGTRRG